MANKIAQHAVALAMLTAACLKRLPAVAHEAPPPAGASEKAKAPYLTVAMPN